MSALSIQVPFPVFQDRDGQPLENGYIWLGEANLNPQTNPVVAYYDDALTIVAAQPLRTINGYVSRSGTPAQIYVDGVNFSILVQDSKGSMVYNIQEGTGISPNASGIVYDPAGTGAVATTVQTKLRESVSVKDFGAVGNGVTDDTAAVQAALDVGGQIQFPEGTYVVTSPLSVTQLNTTLVGETKGTVGASTVIKYTGAATASAVITVQNGKHGFCMDGFDVNANLLADMCIYVIANAGSATHHPVINNVIVRGYNTRGIVLGANSLVISNGQMQLPQMNRVYWQGGALNAIGLLLNAQNCEFIVGNGWYFDIEPTAYNPHSNHIAAVAGGVNVQALLSTRANDYAIKSYGSQVIVNGWRSEDGYIFQTTSVEIEGPCVIQGAKFRATPGSMPQPTATEPTIDFQGVDSTLILTGISTQCSIRVGATAARNVVATGVDFRDAAAGFLYSGPSNRRGIFHRLDTGNVDICGTDAAVQLKNTAGVTTVAIEDGGLRQVPNALAQITANQPSLAAEGYSFFRLTNNGAYDIQGIGTPTNGRRVCFVNMSAGVMTFKHLSVSASPSTWQMRSNTGADIALAQFEMVEMIYDGLSSMWRMWKLA